MTQYHQYLQMSWQAHHTTDIIHANFAWVFCTIQRPFFWNSVKVAYLVNIPPRPERSTVFLSNFSWSYLLFNCLDLSLQSPLNVQHCHFIVFHNHVFLLRNFLWSVACLFILQHLLNSLFSGWHPHFQLYLNVWIYNQKQRDLI